MISQQMCDVYYNNKRLVCAASYVKLFWGVSSFTPNSSNMYNIFVGTLL